MNKKEFAKEVGMVSAIICDTVMKKLYDKMQSKGTGYVSTTEQISEWALEFVLKHEKTNWEDALEKGITPLSKEIKSIICWDDVVFDFAHYKLNEF